MELCSGRHITGGYIAIRIKMKTTLILFVVCGISLASEEKTMYSTKYDNIDVDAILKSERLLNNYIDCLMDEKPCTPDGTELKKNLPDALATGCASCSEAQKNMAEKMYHHLIDNKLESWMLLEEKYDPSGSYRKMYLQSKMESTPATM